MFYFLQRSSSSAAKCLDKQDSCSCVIVPRETAESMSHQQSQGSDCVIVDQQVLNTDLEFWSFARWHNFADITHVV